MGRPRCWWAGTETGPYGILLLGWAGTETGPYWDSFAIIPTMRKRTYPSQGKQAKQPLQSVIPELQNLLQNQNSIPNPLENLFPKQPDPFGILESCRIVHEAWMAHPDKYYESLSNFWQQWQRVTFQSWNRSLGKSADEAAVQPSEFDERFQDPIWSDHIMSDLIKEYYLLTTRWIEDRIYETPSVDERTRKKAAFWTRQGLNSLSPSNFVGFNPKAQLLFWESNGQNLYKGINYWLEDLRDRNIKMVDDKNFEVGKNLATTPGKIIFQNDLIELIQYTPTTKEVHQIPILFVPPWINKYYILDINPQKSLVKYLVDQGFSVFMISWKNPGSDMRDTHFEDYMFSGILKALEAVKSICKVQTAHTVGYCIGGTALTTLLAWLNNHPKFKQKNPIAHATLLCSLVDFSDPGELDVFIDEKSIQAIEQIMEEKGYLEAKFLEHTFRLLRSNSLIWHYAVHRYLYGEDSPPFDILYWNIDGTRLPKAMQSFYLRELYLHNKLVKPNALHFQDIPIDLGAIKQSLYVIGTEQDHITPWKEAFKISHWVKSPVRFVLATSGHIVGVLSNPVTPPKRRYWVGEATGQTDPEAWCEAQAKIPGSWWEDWVEWLGKHCGALQPPPSLGNSDFPVLRDAPGLYVKEK